MNSGFLDMTKICWLPPPVLAGNCITWSQYQQDNTLSSEQPGLILLFYFYPSHTQPYPWISKHCMSSTSNFAIEFPIGFYLSHQVKIIMRELWRLAGRHYVFVTVTLLIMWSSLLCLLCNITPRPNIIIPGNLELFWADDPFQCSLSSHSWFSLYLFTISFRMSIFES